MALSAADDLGTHLREALSDVPALRQWLHGLPEMVAAACAAHGDWPQWQQLIWSLPQVGVQAPLLRQACPTVGASIDVPELTHAVRTALLQLRPWRKGPFNVLGVHVDAEWRCDLKFARLVDRVAPLAGRRVLDVGSGNGYYGLRTLGEGARLVVGVDPSLLFFAQFQALQTYFARRDAVVLPCTGEQVPADCAAFDTVFSMGVLYHRREPKAHLELLRSFLRSGGELVLESLVVNGQRGECLAPSGRYARMKNVWNIPSCLTLEDWLVTLGFRDVHCLGAVSTTSVEQRATEWMPGESLADFLDPAMPERTVEGHPAPTRAIFLATAP